MAAILGLILALQIGTFLLSGVIMVRRMRAADAIDLSDRDSSTGDVTENLAAQDCEMTVIVAIAALEPDEASISLEAARHLSGPVELIYCADSPDEPAVATVLAGLAEMGLENDARISVLTGRDRVSSNPKLDTLEKGYAAARAGFVVLVDGNLRLTPDYLARIRDAWRQGVTLVSTSPVTTDPVTFWAEVEAADISLSHARWMLAGDVLGFRFAHGKLLAFSKSWLESHGGFDSLRECIAEDTALTRLVRKDRGTLRLVGKSFSMPLYRRNLRTVLERNLRWRRIRTATVPTVYLFEAVNKLWSMVAVASALAVFAGMPVLALVGPVVIGWQIIEGGIIAASGLGWSWRVQAGIILRDISEPFLWLAGWLQRSYRWRGRRFTG